VTNFISKEGHPLETLILTRSDVQQLLNIKELYEALKEAFKFYSQRRENSGWRVRAPLKYDGSSAVVLFPGLVDHIPAFTIKNHAKFPGESPAIKGVINLHDIKTGGLLAIMDSAYITSVRTGLAGAMGTHLLARKDSRSVAVIGAGVQGRLQLHALSALRDFKEVYIYDENEDNAKDMVKQQEKKINAVFHICQSLREAVSKADIIITATWSKKPFLYSDMIQAGTHITTLGPDEPNKAEVSAELIRKALFVCDDRELAISMGVLGGVGLNSSVIDAEIGEVIHNPKLGRENDDQMTIFGMVGLPFQDLAAAWQVYLKALNLNIGQTIDFFN